MAQLNASRWLEHTRIDPPKPFEPWHFKGCGGHTLALVFSRFNTLFCEWALNNRIGPPKKK